VTEPELPEGARLVLIHGLELCAAVMHGDPPEELLERAELMFVVASEHIELTKGD
jgi:hypothetical protein